jgi:hypothetical protein
MGLEKTLEKSAATQLASQPRETGCGGAVTGRSARLQASELRSFIRGRAMHESGALEGREAAGNEGLAVQTKPSRSGPSLERQPATAGAIERARGGGEPLPEQTRAQMETTLGTDLGGVRIHADSTSDALSRSLGAEAFTTGTDVFFRQGAYQPGGQAGQELLAHELTHVVQQGGQPQRVNADSKTSSSGGAAEREADSVAGHAIGQSETGQTGASSVRVSQRVSAGDLVQRRVWVGATRNEKRKLTSNGTLVVPTNATSAQLNELKKNRAAEISIEAAWEKVQASMRCVIGANPNLIKGRTGYEGEVRAKFLEWVELLSSFENLLEDDQNVRPDKNAKMVDYTEDRIYLDWDQLATALIGETDPKMLKRMDVENDLAASVAADASYPAQLDTLLSELCSKLSQKDKTDLAATTSRYAQFSSLAATVQILSSPSNFEMDQRCILLDEISQFLRHGELSLSEEFNTIYDARTPKVRSDRMNPHTLNEMDKWVKESRGKGVPLQAGVSGTTARICAMGKQAGMSDRAIYKLAWCMFAFYNGMWRGWSGTHRLHDVMSAASQFVPVAKFGYMPDMTEL